MGTVGLHDSVDLISIFFTISNKYVPIPNTGGVTSEEQDQRILQTMIEFHKHKTLFPKPEELIHSLNSTFSCPDVRETCFVKNKTTRRFLRKLLSDAANIVIPHRTGYNNDRKVISIGFDGKITTLESIFNEIEKIIESYQGFVLLEKYTSWSSGFRCGINLFKLNNPKLALTYPNKEIRGFAKRQMELIKDA